MALMSNGVKRVISIERIVTEKKLCFKVRFEDFMGNTRTKEVMDIKNIEELRWSEAV